MKMEQGELEAAKDRLQEISGMVQQHLGDSVSMFAVLESQSEQGTFALKCIEVKRNDDTLEFDRHLFESALEAYTNEESAYADIREALEDKNKVAVAHVDFFVGNEEEGTGGQVLELCEKAMHLAQDNESCEVFSVDDIDRVLGVVFRYAVGKDAIYAYQKVPRMWVAKRSGMLLPRKEGFELYTKESLKFGAHFDFLICAQYLFVRKIATLEQQFGFVDIFKNHASDVCRELGDLIIDEQNLLQGQIDAATMSIVRKLVKVQASPVLRMERSVLRRRLSEIDAYRNEFTFDDDDRIVLRYKKDIRPFLKMLNDEIVHSPLTGTMYESPNKTLIQ